MKEKRIYIHNTYTHIEAQSLFKCHSFLPPFSRTKTHSSKVKKQNKTHNLNNQTFHTSSDIIYIWKAKQCIIVCAFFLSVIPAVYKNLSPPPILQSHPCDLAITSPQWTFLSSLPQLSYSTHTLKHPTPSSEIPTASSYYLSSHLSISSPPPSSCNSTLSCSSSPFTLALQFPKPFYIQSLLIQKKKVFQLEENSELWNITR